ncbi:MAG: class I SAM-dependent methyltransferase [Elusimicrobia bacterium]|nr:class I SAM-dependent methyltransferase [Elusimicrobiota bacterium]
MTTTTNAAKPTLDEIRDKQRDSWNKFAPGWKKWDDFAMDFLRPAGEGILKEARLAPGMTVLDVACGTGEPGLTAATIVGPKGKVTGTDLSEEMLRNAQDKAKKLGVASYETKVADACALPFKDGAFDAVICRMGVMFFPDPAKGVAEFFRVLKAGGRLALCAWGEAKKNPWATTISDVVNAELGLPAPAPDMPGLFRLGAPGALAGTLEKAGFREVRASEISGERDYDDPVHYWTMMTEIAAPIAGPLSKADDAARTRCRDKVVAAAASFMKNGRPTFPYAIWIASGVK